MSTKHVFNSADGLVIKSLRGVARLNPALKLHIPSKTAYVDQPPTTRVAVIAGGGAGHEPAHAGYTGRGMLTASVSGDIFASPSAAQVLMAIELTAFGSLKGDLAKNLMEGSGDLRDKPKDVLVLINNYTGDRLNFGLAIERARALYGRWFKIESVVNADDVSLLPRRTKETDHDRDAQSDGREPDGQGLVGPRGLAANILVCKILGAVAERGADLATVKAYGDAVVTNLASVGVGLEHCHVPGRERSDAGSEGLGQGECEIGLGLHNERGAFRQSLGSAEELVKEMLSLILRSKDTFVKAENPNEDGDDVVLFINNLGGMSQLEMNAIIGEVVVQLDERGIHPLRIYQSAYMTSLNAPGFSVSILNTSAAQRQLRIPNGVPICSLLDDATDAVAWVGERTSWPKPREPGHRPRHALDTSQSEARASEILQLVRRVADGLHSTSSAVDKDQKPATLSSSNFSGGTVRAACKRVIEVSSELTAFDEVTGDGDCGETFSRGANAILQSLDKGKLSVESRNLGKLVSEIGEVLEHTMGGTIGALFAIYFAALSRSLETSSGWPASLNDALLSLSKHTPAKPGDRTIMDALYPFCASLADGEDIETASRAARRGAENTRGMQPKLGRAVYVRELSRELPPDPGAWGIVAIVEGLAQGLAHG
ncbi:hypothetical protein AX17_002786 [Amanita inopinata Kibby_2008]|nr:hypothetical protein AX17_002786 [Amanita inopinata Kibby_2008]